VSAAIDVNILLYASDTSSEFSQRAQAFLAERAANSEIIYVSWGTIMAYLRIATHPSIFGYPLSLAEASANVNALLDLPQVRPLREEEGFWELFQEITQIVAARGNLIPAFVSQCSRSAPRPRCRPATSKPPRNDLRRFWPSLSLARS